MRALLACLGIAALCCACNTPPDSLASREGEPGPAVDARPPATHRRVVIVMIGDGMGPGQLEAASHYRAGEAGALFVDSLPQTRIATASPTGITDSAAAATVMATGAYTDNGVVGLDRRGNEVRNLVELARLYDRATGLVTTTELTHATPASFAAHVPSRGQGADIAAQMAELSPDVLLGGGARYFEERDDGRDLVEELEGTGYQVVRGAGDLRAAVDAKAERVLGLFSGGHMPFAVDRAADSELPSLAEMSTAAIALLDRDPDGFFLMIEGGRIDHAGHANQLERCIGETLAFDDAVRAVSEWAEGQDDVTLLVTADHETGGLEVLSGSGAGVLPAVRWRWGAHTNASVIAAGTGPGSEALWGDGRDHRWIHSIAAARIGHRDLRDPPPVVIADGYTADLRGAAAEQELDSDALPLRLDRLALGADDFGLGVGVEGVFAWDGEAVVVLLDLDYGAGTGVRAFDGGLSDADTPVDQLLSSLRIDAPDDAGWGADFALVSIDGLDPKVTQLWERAGLRGLRAPYGTAAMLGARGAAINYGDGVRTRGEAIEPVAGRGFEAFVPWAQLSDDGVPPAGARIAAIALLVSEDGAVISNQALPAFDAGAAGATLPAPLPFEP